MAVGKRNVERICTQLIWSMELQVKYMTLGRWAQANNLGLGVNIDAGTTTAQDVLNQLILPYVCRCVDWRGEISFRPAN
ncbi:uncharacterized protein ColSpa_11936 [Colletotrichum spaethianum]|uniref:Uncharacterized protein n=1 Tax=Colletotrichum spaethianum TaxID=700344 RepID=A0AA37PG94_9PEZI|nr:uncharacterized protein ColSpa_11936 [Colletotrichum spaethianum]GKT51755.1 hypothetical protein ColSpa_11936 [Colletotrichum spaethianum]